MRLGALPRRGYFNGEPALVYEVHLTNFSAAELTLDQLELVEEGSRRVRAQYSDANLAEIISRSDHASDPQAQLRIPAGLHATLYLTVPLTQFGSGVPKLVHRLTYTSETGRKERSVVEGAIFRIPIESPLVIAPPLRGEGWTAIYSDAWERGHRRVMFATRGIARIPGRYAIDWVRVAADGRHANGGDREPAHWIGYGSEVLAVADAVVAFTSDDMAEPATVDSARKVDIEDASGDYVVLDLGKGKYAFYEHLKPSSISVAVGVHVHRSQPIAAVGYTGQSTGPHLHFHVADSIAPLDSEGLPYVFDKYRIVGRFSSAEAFGAGNGWKSGSAEVHQNELPPPFAVVEFP
ncbi:MAG TPA: M23 family metallopeptidase [Bryobacteraceae bacterium]|nr:M23 family metallopeptidase [Bryobacteraceae bacterium]